MDQQHTIFDETFDSPERLRRRDIMPAWLKVYTWITFGISIVITFLILLQMPEINGHTPDAETAGYRAGITLAAVIIAVMYLSPVLLVLFEIKWAIWFNLIAGSIWVTAILSSAILSDPDNLYVGVTIIFYIPFWIGLLPLLQKWKAAASGRALRKERRATIS